jgi:NAD(P)-dependent dehydrogenase (short-subunit alcohol dehydrogenase family)
VARCPAIGMSITSALTAALPALTANLALEIAPVRVNLIAAGFVDTPLSAELLGDQLEKRRNQLRTTLPIGRVVGPGGCGRARRTHYGQHRPHGRNL